MNGPRQQIQYSLALEQADQGEAPVSGHQRTEPFVAKPAPESSAVTEQLMEEVCNRENLVRAWKRVRQNKGGPGVDGMTIDDAKDYLREHWPSIRSQLLAGTYQPQPVKRVEIPKPDGGVRKLGVPCVVDRLIQQALLQVLQGQWDPTFSEHSYGFRPGRSAHQAVAQAQQYIAAGYNVVVDLDLEKFFDRVNHDSLMARVAARVTDKRVLKLIRAFLKAGVMEDGLVSPVDEGTPQGGPLSPLLSNLVLDDLDKELTRRGHRFCRYADDCNIYVRDRKSTRLNSSHSSISYAVFCLKKKKLPAFSSPKNFTKPPSGIAAIFQRVPYRSLNSASSGPKPIEEVRTRFFLMLPRPPRSTLFPYTTLFRSGAHRSLRGQDPPHQAGPRPQPAVPPAEG